jgi:hypothetical protein
MAQSAQSAARSPTIPVALAFRDSANDRLIGKIADRAHLPDAKPKEGSRRTPRLALKKLRQTISA